MKVLVVGAGSIGKRHISNLAKLGQEIIVCDIDQKNALGLEGVVSVHSSLEKALDEGPQTAFICSFSNDHISPAIKCAKAGCHLFIEKPLSTSIEGINELINICEEKKLITMVGCNMRFHPSIKRLKDIVDNDQRFKDLLWANIEFGYYLPFAKPDYISHYMANRSKGGNIIFDVIHELDYAIWLMGEPKSVLCRSGIISDLKIDTQDYADILVEFVSGKKAMLHLDYLQHDYTRRCKLVSKNATAVWDHSSGKIGIVDVENKEWEWEDSRYELAYNEMYIDEVLYFMDCISKKNDTMNAVSDALLTTKLALAAMLSSEKRTWEQVNEG